jgi:CDP-diacylglycerol--glycerol-3-phosphate 3-phosphatidyltransferase
MIKALYSLPNLLTYFRIAVIPAIFCTLMADGELWSRWVSCVLFFLASVSDYFDGYFAREMKVDSKLGKFLDPIADKLLVTVVLIILAKTKVIAWYDTAIAAAIISREIFVSGLREYLGNFHIQMPVSRLAKWKTASQLFAIGFLIFGRNYTFKYYNSVYDLFCFDVYVAGVCLLLISAVLTIMTGVQYMKAAAKYMEDE